MRDPDDTGPTGQALVARELRRHRETAGLSITQLATRTGYSRTYIASGEKPSAALVSTAVVERIDTELNAGGALIALRAQAEAERQARQRAGADQQTPVVQSADESIRHRGINHAAAGTSVPASTMSGVVAAFDTRSEFIECMPPNEIFGRADNIKACGLSLNYICQHYGDHRLMRLIEDGAQLQALFLDPDGEHIKRREREEGLNPGDLIGLTRLNMQMLQRLRASFADEVAQRMEIRVYDETIRFNLIFINNQRCIVQPYLPKLRGVDAPTFVVCRSPDGSGMYETFSRVYESAWSGSR